MRLQQATNQMGFHLGAGPHTVGPMADATDPEQEDSLVRALADLKVATEQRRSLDHGSPDLLAALKRERLAMELVRDLVEGLDKRDSGRA
jgi:hypothetical protein